MPTRQRAAIVLRFYEEFSERDSAEILGCPVGAINQLVARATATLRDREGRTMIDVERLVRDTLARHESEAPTPDPLEAHPVAVRTRRRQVMNAVGAALIAQVIALGATSGIGALRAA